MEEWEIDFIFEHCQFSRLQTRESVIDLLEEADLVVAGIIRELIGKLNAEELGHRGL